MGQAVQDSQGRRRELSRCWLERQGRLLSPTAILLRFVLVASCIAAIELGRKEGLAFAVALLWHGLLYQLLILGRVRQLLLDEQDPEDARPRTIRPGWVDVDWRLRGITHHTLRGITTASLCAVVLYFNPLVGVAALIACHFLTEGTGVVLGRIIDPLLQVEVERRMAVMMGNRPRSGSDRGDFRSMGG